MKKNNNDIDFVQLWVDGSDKSWLLEKSKYLPDLDIDDSIKRYRNWDNLHFWFRGVEKYAPWVRKIHLVTCGHYPSWINTEHPKLNLVKHSDFIPEKYLPTFNSSSIVINLHRINNLSEYFVLFNDDLFILQQLYEKDFFQNDFPCDKAIFNKITPRIPFSYNIFNNMYVINNHFNKNDVLKKYFFKWFNVHYKFKENLLFLYSFLSKNNSFPGIGNHHLPISYKKNNFKEVWNIEYDWLDKTSMNKFRTKEDLTDWLFRYWHIMEGEFHPRPIPGKYYGLTKNNNNNIYNDIKKQKHKLICVNDTDDDINFEVEQQKLNTVFEYIFPNKSSFEL